MSAAAKMTQNVALAFRFNGSMCDGSDRRLGYCDVQQLAVGKPSPFLRRDPQCWSTNGERGYRGSV